VNEPGEEKRSSTAGAVAAGYGRAAAAARGIEMNDSLKALNESVREPNTSTAVLLRVTILLFRVTLLLTILAVVQITLAVLVK
jgi:hypothetical protein